MTQPAEKTRKRGETGPRVGLALAGGGPAGAVYEIGALRALDEALEGVDFNQLDVYVGVSAGAFIAANLANDITPVQMCRALLKHEPGEHPFVSENFFRPAFGELRRRGAALPRLLAAALWSFARNPRDRGLLDSLTRLGRALPVGLFDNRPVRDYLERIYSLKDRTDDFRRLAKRLVVVAADLDSGEAVRFGQDGFDDVPISLAVQASSALPGLYPPVEIRGRHYVDGVLLKTMHGSVALEAGAKLLLCLNPLVPVDTVQAVQTGHMRRGKLFDRGLPTVLAQSLRTLIRSRLQAGLESYRRTFPDADVVLFEPDREDYDMFFTNVFSFSSRRRVCEHAYRSTRRQLAARRAELEPVLARHGIRLDAAALADPDRSLWDGVGLGETDRPGVVSDLEAALGRLEALVDGLSG